MSALIEQNVFASNTQGKSNTFLITILLNALKIQQEGNLNLWVGPSHFALPSCTVGYTCTKIKKKKRARDVARTAGCLLPL